MKKLLLLLPLAAALHTAAQNAPYTATWEEKWKTPTLPDSLKKYSAYFALDERRIAYIDEKNGNGITRTTHRIINVTDEKGVAMFNTISIPAYAGIEISDIKARTVSPSGKVVDLLASSIKQVKSEEGVPEYIFALEGVEKGSFIEWMYTEQRPLSFFGVETVQFSIPTARAIFSVSAPKGLRFDVKGYNGIAPIKDTLLNDTRYYYSYTDGIPAMKKETYSAYEANLMRVDYKVSYTSKDPDVRLFTWNDMAKNLYKNVCTFTDKELKVAGRYNESIGLKDDDAPLEKINRIEDALKTNIIISKQLEASDDNTDFSKIISKKLTTESSFTHLFAACLTAANVPFELGLAANKAEHPLDEALENWREVDEYLFYFPRQKRFLDPTAAILRSPFIPVDFAGSKGVFAKVTTLGSMTAAMADVRTVDMLPASESHSNVQATVTFNADMTPEIKMVQDFIGYPAYSMRAIFVQVPKEKEKEVAQEIIGLAEKPEDLKSYTITNAAYSNFADNKPVLLTTSFQSPQLIEKAGNKYLFKVGDIIGKQEEMYNDDVRKQPMDIEFIHSLDRTITVAIPDGYKVTNPEQSQLQVQDADKTMGFTSTYALNGQVLTITIHEYYNQLHYPISDYEIFRKVINAAADFNKVVLVLQKV